MTTQPVSQGAVSTLGMVTSPHEVATQCGVRILECGGNAIEAAIATTLALFVTYPHFCGLGGDAFLIISDAHGKVQNISGIGQAAQNVGAYESIIPLRGPRSALTTAGAVDALRCAWEISQRLGGTCSWSALLKPAIELARNGYAITRSERFWLGFRESQAGDLHDIFPRFSANGLIPDEGMARQRPDLARTLALLADAGPRDFYDGQLARQLAHGLALAGSALTQDDLAATRARIEEPLSMSYRGGNLIAHRPPTQGITTLQIMGILEQFDVKSIQEGSAAYYHLLVEAVKQAFVDRDRYVGDPDHVNVPVDHLLSPAHLKDKALAIDPNRAMAWPHAFKTGDTVFVGATDKAGNSVSLLATIYFDWGSGIMAGDTGVLWHNRGASFSLDPAHPNALAAGKRPFHTLNPGMYLKGGKPRIIYGTQGADGQPQTLAAILTRMIDYNMPPLQALARPRFLLGKTFSDTAETLKLESDVGLPLLAELERMGHVMGIVEPQSPLMGHPGAIVIDPVSGQMLGAHDPRSDGVAIGVEAIPG